MLKDYPRIRMAFTVEEPRDTEVGEEREALIKNIRKRITRRPSISDPRSWIGLWDSQDYAVAPPWDDKKNKSEPSKEQGTSLS
jgi:hypothetical protein